MSKQLQRFCEEHPEMIGSMGWWYEGADGYWVDLAEPYDIEGCSTVHEWTVRDVLRALKNDVRKLSADEYRELHG